MAKKPQIRTGKDPFRAGLATGMSLAGSASLAIFGAAAMAVTALNLAAGAALIGGIIPATPLVAGGIMLLGAGMVWGGIKSVLTAANDGNQPLRQIDTECHPPQHAVKSAAPKFSLKSIFGKKPAASNAPKNPAVAPPSIKP